MSESIPNSAAGTSDFVGRVVVVAWHHGEIDGKAEGDPGLLSSLGAPNGTFPIPWPEDIFNWVYRLSYANGTSIFVMRHAEKTGDAKDANLSPLGLQHAQWLVVNLPLILNGQVPFAIFAAAPSHNSDRPGETIRPYADSIGVPVQQQFGNHQFDALAQLLIGVNPSTPTVERLSELFPERQADCDWVVQPA